MKNQVTLLQANFTPATKTFLYSTLLSTLPTLLRAALLIPFLFFFCHCKCWSASASDFAAFPPTLPSIDATLAKDAQFSRSAIPSKPPSNEWKVVPSNLVGRWAHGTQYRVYKKDYKSGSVDTSRTLIYSPQIPMLGNNSLEQAFEFAGQQDRSGRTWLFVGIPLVKALNFDPGITAYNCLIENKPFALPDADFAVKQRIYTTWVGDKSQKILLANRDLSYKKFKVFPNNQLAVVELTRSYQENGMPQQDEIHETVLTRINDYPRQNLLQAINVAKPNTDDLFKAFQLTNTNPPLLTVPRTGR